MPLTRPRILGTALVLTVALTSAACGSRLDPSTVAGVAGTGSGAVATGTGVTGATTDGSGAGVGGTDPGTTGSGGSSGSGGSGAGGQTGSGGTGTTPSGTSTTGANSATGGVKAGSCSGFKNTTGITDDTIRVANIADISGPVPGLFQAAQDAVKAFVAYYNDSGAKLCGRSLTFDPLDTRTDAGGDQQAYSTACGKDFAVLGAVSSQDQGGAAAAQQCAIPDIRAFVTTPQRSACTTCFATYTIQPDVIATSTGKFFLSKQKAATQHAAMFWVDVQAASVNARSFAAGFEKQGFHFDIQQGIPTSEFNYAPYVQQMKDKGTQFVQYFGPYQFAIRLQQAMAQQNFDVPVYLEDPTIYDQNYVDTVGDAGDKSFVYSVIELFDNTKIAEMALYRNWLNQVHPGAIPNYYGLFAWSAARLFVQEATKLGGRLSRSTLVDALRKVDNYTGNGVHAPMHVGSKQTSGCMKIIQLNGGTWSQVSPGDFMCGPTIETGVKN